MFNIYKKQVSGDYSSKEIIKSLKAKNVNKIILGHLNINSVGNKIDSVRHIIGSKIDSVRHIIGNNIDSVSHIIGNKIDSVRHIIGNNIDSARHIIGNNIDIFFISETKQRSLKASF